MTRYLTVTRSAYHKKYYAENREAILKQHREYYYRNLDNIKNKSKKWYQETREARLKYRKRYYMANREKCLKYQRKRNEQVKKTNNDLKTVDPRVLLEKVGYYDDFDG